MQGCEDTGDNSVRFHGLKRIDWLVAKKTGFGFKVDMEMQNIEPRCLLERRSRPYS